MRNTFTKMLREAIFVFAAVIVFAGATVVNQCGTGTPFSDSDQITVSACEKPECILKQGTTITIEIKLIPSRTIQTLFNNVNGIISGIPLPFIGVDGTNACDNIYNKDGTKASCPLQKDVEYIYRNSFPILQFYPRIALVVHFALREGDEQLICFELPSKITK